MFSKAIDIEYCQYNIWLKPVVIRNAFGNYNYCGTAAGANKI